MTRLLVLLSLLLTIPNLYSAPLDPGLQQAINRGHGRQVKQFLQQGHSAEDALHYAVQHGQPFIFNIICDKVQDINVPNEKGLTPLERTVKAGSIAKTKILLHHGAYPDAAKLKGFLKLSKDKSRHEIRHMLLEHRDGPLDPQTALVKARRKGQDAWADYLERLANNDDFHAIQDDEHDAFRELLGIDPDGDLFLAPEVENSDTLDSDEDSADSGNPAPAVPAGPDPVDASDLDEDSAGSDGLVDPAQAQPAPAPANPADLDLDDDLPPLLDDEIPAASDEDSASEAPAPADPVDPDPAGAADSGEDSEDSDPAQPAPAPADPADPDPAGAADSDEDAEDSSDPAQPAAAPANPAPVQAQPAPAPANLAPAANPAPAPIFGPQLYDPQADKDFIAQHGQDADRKLDVMKAEHRLFCHEKKLMGYNPDADLDTVDRYKDSKDLEELIKALEAVFRLRAHEPVDVANPLLKELHDKIYHQFPGSPDGFYFDLLKKTFLGVIPILGWAALVPIVLKQQKFINSTNCLRCPYEAYSRISLRRFIHGVEQFREHCRRIEHPIVDKLKSLANAGKQGQPEFQHLKKEQLNITEVWNLMGMIEAKRTIHFLEKLENWHDRTCSLYKTIYQLLVDINHNPAANGQNIATFERNGKEFIDAYYVHGSLRKELLTIQRRYAYDWYNNHKFGAQDPDIPNDDDRKLYQFVKHVESLVGRKQYNTIDSGLLDELRV